jgi:hypothetical protein
MRWYARPHSWPPFDLRGEPDPGDGARLDGLLGHVRDHHASLLDHGFDPREPVLVGDVVGIGRREHLGDIGQRHVEERGRAIARARGACFRA